MPLSRSSRLKAWVDGLSRGSRKHRRALHFHARNTLSTFWAPTQSKKKLSTGDVHDDGHDLLVRAGFLRQAQPGVFHTLPLGLRVLNKVEALIDKHMQTLGASKLALSSLSSQDLWEKSGRLHGRNPELFQLTDRKGAKNLLAPTHEEEITNIVRHAVQSYKDLPLRLYQVSRKYRDEARPRQGLLRGREFVMKDLYTFDLTEEHAMETYSAVQKAYKAFFDDLNLPYLVATADSGNMGGNHSHEYHFASQRGEDTIVKCSACSMSVNQELYVGKHDATSGTLGVKHDVAVWAGPILRKLEKKLIKPQSEQQAAQFEQTYGQTWLEYEEAYSPEASKRTAGDQVESVLKVYYPQDCELNLHAIKRLYSNLDTSNVDPQKWLDARQGHCIHLRDSRISESQCYPPDVDHSSSEPLRLTEAPFLLTKARENDTCPDCGATTLRLHQAIEIGHTFHLGSRYSEPLGATIKDASNEPIAIEMGCHGVGVSRLMGATATMLADAQGLNWPLVLAPFRMVLVGTGNSSVDEVVEVYDYVMHHVRNMSGNMDFDAVIDDRERPLGWKLNDADLIGYPFIVILGKGWRDRKAVELQSRRLGVKEEVGVEDLAQRIISYSQKL
ncbi:hypothetical protein AC579_6601 [Pseudocercospora musae]|uniref:proline--tRNA ligase n=1 Tax=Pseudocercospora musae TaxID=113226 RepID=A0A139IG41_9PEZI|nr:hypothetical protein AC579_6601 [Pseudocercospora musae]